MRLLQIEQRYLYKSKYKIWLCIKVLKFSIRLLLQVQRRFFSNNASTNQPATIKANPITHTANPKTISVLTTRN